MKEGDKTFTLFWRTGSREVVHGRDPAEAMTLAGYSSGAIRALDFWAHGDNDKYEWDASKRTWISLEVREIARGIEAQRVETHLATPCEAREPDGGAGAP